MTAEQVLNVLPCDVQVWVRERKPRTSEEVGQLAEDYLQAWKTNIDRPPMQQREQHGAASGPSPKATGTVCCFKCGKNGHLSWQCSQGRAPVDTSPARPGPELKCFNCGRKGHMARQCPGNALVCTDRAEQSQPVTGATEAGVIEGWYVKNIVLDTGCSRTLVKKELVDVKKMLPGQMVSVRCAHGDAVQYPLATLSMDVKGHPIQVVAAVSETLPAAALLGTDVPELVQLLEGRSLGSRK